MVALSIIIPTLNEAAVIEATLSALRPLRRAGHEVIVADGGSEDATRALAAGRADRVIEAPRGRARQMNVGAAQAAGAALWFLHADTQPPAGADRALLRALRERPWGRFDVRLSGAHPLLRIVERLINLRSRWSGVATGDQGLFVDRALFEAAGGFPDLPLMEDVALCRILKRRAGRPVCLRAQAVTSSRRWEERGIARTILLMWRLRLGYALGVDATALAARYR